MQKQALTPLDKQTILLALASGIPLGASVAAITSMFNKMETDKELSEDKDPSKRDDNTLYLNLPSPVVKQAADDPPPAITGSGTALAMSGGLLSMLGSYALVRKLYQEAKLKDLQDRLDKEQERTLSRVTEDATKTAGILDIEKGSPAPGGTVVSSASGMLLASALLTALGSGWLAHRTLSHMFPQVNKDIVTDGPPRVVIRRTPPPGQGADGEPETMKQAADWREAAEQAAIYLGVEFCKRASSSDLANLVAAVAQGRGRELEETMASMDTLDLVKGAALLPVPRWKGELAIAWLSKSAALKPLALALAGAEIAEAAPFLWKQAQALDNVPDLRLHAIEAAGQSRALHLASLFTGGDIEKLASITKEVPANMKMVPATQGAEASLADGIPDLDQLLSGQGIFQNDLQLAQPGATYDPDKDLMASMFPANGPDNDPLETLLASEEGNAVYSDRTPDDA